MKRIEEYLRANYKDGFPGRRRRELLHTLDDLIEVLVDDIRNRYTFNMGLQDIAAGLIERLYLELEQAEHERGAAIERLHDLRDCKLCDHERCANCRWFDDMTMRNRYLSDNWRWGGVQEVSK